MVDGVMNRMMYRVVNRVMMMTDRVMNRMMYSAMSLGHRCAGHSYQYYGG